MLLTEQLLNGVILITNLSRGSTGTGFMFAGEEEVNGVTPIALITCAHVISDKNGVSETRIALNLPEGGSDTWIAANHFWTVSDEWLEWTRQHGPDWWNTEVYSAQKHAHGDIAAMALPRGKEGDYWDTTIQGAIRDVFTAKQSFGRERMKAEGITEGHEVLVMGYAPGGYETEENWPLVRRGAIGQIAPYKRKLTESLVLDGGIFEGTSGGPVMLLPSLIARGGNAVMQGGLLGMVSATSYRQSPLGWVPVNTPTGRKMVLVESQHMGVGYVAPVDAIKEVWKKAVER